MAKRVDKKSMVLQGKKKNSWLLPAAVVLSLAIVGGAVALKTSSQTAATDKANVGTYNVGTQVTYDAAQKIEQTVVQPEFKDGKIYLDLELVKNNKIVKFEIPNQKVTLPNGTTFNSLPITAYVAPSGRVVGAVSFCEPCSGTSFHIEGNELVCNVCGTRWTLEDLKGVSGGCLTYPPDEVKYEVKDGKMVFDEKELRAWQPRV
ncbi:MULTISPECIES: Fe-S-containing protein [Carboxydocella]|uniref:Predicted membrane protein n=2 Tax=Carboxydocella TaxID=178898 RepID=A0A1T4M369_9FIRM|nr:MULTISPECIES: Fe-S-containing protein [Carboxydocella]AVX21066.1 putative membrane protein (DUF2318) [Carboxydocella thermautotrophica]AVX31486.1 putative membrane protein (DUF2318) [Carboxydocella thermautotrophica]SJZ61326.1 Predicted membrane protein [Carboxydocella sporoproducens DSM 16521]GAW28822.1 hypothetical protein ULO1_13920 [Carboxydocella sp. ULO1]GAW32765.1 hypothetical protein JDF658_25300 [Carboxydocella sp. JDF658]